MERLATNNGLQGADPAAPAVLAEVEKRRNAVKSDFDPGLAALAQRDFPNRQVLMQDLKSALDKANDYRKRADAALPQSRDQRDETLRKTFIPVITDSVNAALKVWFSALYTTAKNDPQLALLATIKEIGWQMRDVAGKERSNVSSSIAAGAALTPDMILTSAQFRARVDMLWELLQHLTSDPDMHPAIKEAMRVAQDQYFKGFRGRADEIRKIGAEGGKYPLTATQYVEEIDATTRHVACGSPCSRRCQRGACHCHDRSHVQGVDDRVGAFGRRPCDRDRIDADRDRARHRPLDQAFDRRAAAREQRHGGRDSRGTAQ